MASSSRNLLSLSESNPRNPRLNDDVLLVLATFLDVPTLSSLLQTSRTLYTSSPYLLLRTPVKITRASGLLSFYLFLSRDEAQRRPLLHHLHISLSHHQICFVQPDDMRALSQVLKRAERLKTLEITQCECHEEHDLARVAWSYSLLGPIITACSGITHLKLHNFTHAYLTSTLARAPSSLVSLHLDFSWRSIRIRDIAADIRLARFGTTLEELTLFGDFHYFTLEPSPSFPRLRCLTMATFDHFIMIDVIARFPHVAQLQFSHYSGFISDRGLDAHRLRSKSYQAEYLQWSRLERLAGGLRSLYVAAIACPVRRLDVVGHISNEKRERRLHAVLEDAQPQILSLALSPGNDGLESRLFPASAAGSLKSLILTVDFAHAAVHLIEETIADRINRLVALPIPPSTTIMVIFLKLTVLTKTPTHAVQPVLDVLDRTPKEDLACRLATRHPSLSTVFVNVHELDFAYGWNVSRINEGRPVLEPMDDEEAKDVVQREELRASPVLVADGG